MNETVFWFISFPFRSNRPNPPRTAGVLGEGNSFDCSKTTWFTRFSQFLAMGTLCRSANNECDLPEHCTGDTGECPADMYKKNGIPCGGKADGLCYMGECPTLDNQCEQIWGYGERSKNCLKTVFFKRKKLFSFSNLEPHGSCGCKNWATKRKVFKQTYFKLFWRANKFNV